MNWTSRRGLDWTLSAGDAMKGTTVVDWTWIDSFRWRA